MRQVFVQLFGKPIRKSVAWYLSKPRGFQYQNINIIVYPGVFHPGFFFSTRFVLKFLATQDLKNQNFLEVGSGSGLISIFASKKGAKVTAIDINKKAVVNTLENGNRNNVNLDVRESDLFTNVPPIRFDWIVINPPYYPENPKDETEYAWNCGLNHQYFEVLFSNLQNFTTENSRTLIVLSDVCDLKTIFAIAKSNRFDFEKIAQKRVWADGWNYLYWIKRL
jgi:release factor glutamine methyltransferase